MAESLGLIETLAPGAEPLPELSPGGELLRFPPESQWDDWTEYDAQTWPQRTPRHRMLVPTTCFNCESACGLLAYVDKETLEVQRFEGNPRHPASRGRTCAKGPATSTRCTTRPHPAPAAARGERRRPVGQVGWDECWPSWAGIARAFREGRGTRSLPRRPPGPEGWSACCARRASTATTATPTCSGAARLGYALWRSTTDLADCAGSSSC
jgi:hypothetical protein